MSTLACFFQKFFRLKMGIIRSVQGDLISQDMGNIMIHEHIILILLYRKKKQTKIDISMSDRWQIDYFSNQNLKLSAEDISIAVDELHHFFCDGGSVILTSPFLVSVGLLTNCANIQTICVIVAAGSLQSNIYQKVS